MKRPLRCHCAIAAMFVVCLAGPALGPPDNFEANAVRSFPAGWGDAARVDPASTPPKPSALAVGPPIPSVIRPAHQ